ncbi:hypothetical protein PILCRDRAFT_73511 [Piloderma croceum F 1598]|uniref:NAD-dependent epimerase/dehydratase domain-containing protein n=1 Tax=Piloderma croceum (strain F 1598) TaxID=765440 RepID=A0A0C3F6B6_PILCF|nr:hypothetical protein PILCRDRAFT_73511 [Piloderma croceum F 1598]
MTTPDNIIPTGSLVLVTGANGFTGTHVVEAFLAAGYRVRGTVRAVSKILVLQAMWEKKYGAGTFEVAVVEDFTKDGAFDDAMKGVSGVAHVAGDLSFSPVPSKVIDPMVKGVVSILTAAAAQPTVKNFVLTSSSYACFWPKPNVEFDIGEDMWNEESVEKAYSLAETDPLKPWHIYACHKVLVERAAWKFMKEEKPAFSMNAIMPNTTFGPILDPAQATSTAGMLKGLFEGNWPAFSGILPRKSKWGVDVRDVGRLHVLALTSPSLSAGGVRMYAASEPFNTNDILQLFRKLYPKKTFLPDVEGLGRDLTHVDNKRAGALLGGWIKFEESIKANTENL